MKISVAQTRPIKGDIKLNIENHKKLINLALDHGAEAIIFPELSITGYEPELATELATTQDDARFEDLQKISNTGNIIIGVGVPTKNVTGTCISMILFQPNQPRQTYSKKYLHDSEDKYFVSGQNDKVVIHSKPEIALAICYELSVPQHSENAHKNGATIYLASVVEDINGVDRAMAKLSSIGNKYAMTVAMSNCIGKTGAYHCPGKSSIWNNQGELAGQLNDINEGILIYDTVSSEVIEASI